MRDNVESSYNDIPQEEDDEASHAEQTEVEGIMMAKEKDDEDNPFLPSSSPDCDSNSNNCSHSAAIHEDDYETSRGLVVRRLFYTTLIPDDAMGLDVASAWKLLKFWLLTVLSIVISFAYIRWVGYLEHDAWYTLSDFWMYESSLVATDLAVWFAVGRLWQKPGIDHGAWLLWGLAGNAYSSYSSLFPFLQHSATLYEMHCRWPMALWIFLIVVIAVVTVVVGLHVQAARATPRLLLRKLMELTICMAIWLVPYVKNPYFHLHHWYVGWLVGMHFNLNAWWSRAAMAWCWGVYINGIAVWGRDPVLTCGLAMHLSSSQGCPYLQCYVEGIKQHQNHPENSTIPDVKPMITPDWRNCSAESFHP